MVSARRIRDFACPRRPSRIKLCRESTAFTSCGTTVSSYPTIPGNSASSAPAVARSLAIRFSRSSSLTERPTRAGVNSLLRSAPSVVGGHLPCLSIDVQRPRRMQARVPGDQSCASAGTTPRKMKYRFRAVIARTREFSPQWVPIASKTTYSCCICPSYRFVIWILPTSVCSSAWTSTSP